MDFVGSSSGGGSLGSENGPPIFSESNRTSAYDDLRSVFIYIFIVAIFFSFFLILPGIRNEKFPTFLCITTSLIVTSIILISLFGTSWHVGQAHISAPYKAFSKDRVQGELSVLAGLRSVNITLRSHKYYELQVAHKPVIIRQSQHHQQRQPSLSTISNSSSNQQVPTSTSSTSTRTSKPLNRTQKVSLAQQTTTTTTTTTSTTSSPQPPDPPIVVTSRRGNLADELLAGGAADGSSVDTDLELDEVFPPESSSSGSDETPNPGDEPSNTRPVRSPSLASITEEQLVSVGDSFSLGVPGFSVERSNVDINYNERFYWIEPNQMRQEYHNALERGLPYPILTVVEYLSQDEAGFNWSRQYRFAGYYTHILLWLSFCLSLLMFFLHCATPKYGIYTMQTLGCLLLFTNFTYSTLVPKGDQKLVIPFEGQQLTLKFGWNYWLVLVGGCLSLIVGTLIVIIDSLFPDYIFTTILDVDFDTPNKYYKLTSSGRSQLINKDSPSPPGTPEGPLSTPNKRLVKPPFFIEPTNEVSSRNKRTTLAIESSSDKHQPISTSKQSALVGDAHLEVNSQADHKASHLKELFVKPLIVQQSSPKSTFSRQNSSTNDSEMTSKRRVKLVERDSSVVEMLAEQPMASSDQSDVIKSDNTNALKTSSRQKVEVSFTEVDKIPQPHHQQNIQSRQGKTLKSTEPQAVFKQRQHSRTPDSDAPNNTSSQIRL